MYPVSQRFHELTTQSTVRTRCRIYFIPDTVDCTDDEDVIANGTLLVRDAGDTDSSRRISGDNGVSFPDYFNTESNLVIGTTVSKQIQIALLNLDGGLNSFDFGRCKVFIDAWDAANSEWLSCPMGVYIIDTPTKLNTKIVNASGYDQMQKLDKTADAWWNNIDWTGGVTVSELITQIATECGVSVSENLSANILNGSNSYTEAPFTANKTTYRDILGKLAGITGTIAYFDRDGALDMRWFEYAVSSSTTETLTGDPVSFVNGGTSSITSLTIPFSPIQDLNGYDHPWPGGGGKNKYDGVSSKTLASGGFVAGGGVLSTSYRITLPAAEYKIIFNFTASTTTECRFFKADGSYFTSGGKRVISGQNVVTINCTEDVVGIGIYINAAGTASNIMICLSSVTDYSYAPYSNICPISGRTGLSVYVSPTTAQADATTYPVSWQTEAGTVYGGYVNPVTGELVVDRAMVTLDGTEAWAKDTDSTSADHIVCFRAYLRNDNIKKPDGTASTRNYIGKMFADTMPTLKNGYANQYPMADTVMGVTGYSGASANYLYIVTNKSASNIQSVAELKSWLAENPTTVVYELASPLTYQLTPQEVELLVGQNYVWGDTGEDVTAAITTRNIVTIDADAFGSGVMSLDIAEYAVTAIDMLEVLPLDPDLDVSIGTGDNIYQLAGNPFLVGADVDEVETLATPIYNRLKTVVPYKPLDMRLITDWSLESGDVIRAIIDGNTVVLPIMQQTMTWRGGYVLSDMQSSGDAERPGMDWQERSTYQNDVQMHEFENTVNELLSRIQDMTGNYTLIQQTVSAIEQTVSSQGTTIQSILDPSGQIWTAIKTNSADLSDLEDAVNGEISERKSYIRFLPAEPAIVLGVDTGNEIKLKLVNNVIYFFNGSDDSTDLSLAYAYFNNEEAGADRFVATQFVQIGNADSASRWLFKTLSNGDLILDMV